MILTQRNKGKTTKSLLLTPLSIYQYHHQPNMLLKNSICNTKKFFQKTIRSFKSFFSPDIDYQKLPKTSPYNPNSVSTPGFDMNAQTSYQQGLENFYSVFKNRWDNSEHIAKQAPRKRNKNKIVSKPTEELKQGDEGSLTKVEKRDEEDMILKSTKKREQRSLLVAQKLKEIEMMDMSNVDHVLDIEEVLHYYSRLTCPAYLDIVDKFFMELYTEYLGSPASPKCFNSRPKFRSVRS